MNKTTFKNSYSKYFEQLVHRNIISIATNNIDTLQIAYTKEEKEKTLTLKASISRDEKGLLDFHFNLGLQTPKEPSFDTILEEVKQIDEVNLFEAEDMFCKEQALEIKYNDNSYCHILIYTDMAEMTLEFFQEKLEAEKFKKVSF